MANKLVAAIDHGTSSTRCILFDGKGAPVATAQRTQTMHYPEPGWVELDMDEVWQRTQECIHEGLSSAGASPADVVGIGIANERETVVLWDRRTGRPVAPAITWQDTRTAAAADALAADGGIHRFQHRTGLEAVGTTSHAHNGKVRVTIGHETEVFQPPRGKNVDEQLLVDVRRMLSNAGFAPYSH